MLRFARFALPLVLAVAVAGCDSFADDASDTSPLASAVAPPIEGPDTLPTCQIRGYSIDRAFITFRVKGLTGRAEVLGQTQGRRQTTASIGGLQPGTIQVRAYSGSTIVSSKLVTVTPPETIGGVPICSY